jgi:hypothetical protein
MRGVDRWSVKHWEVTRQQGRRRFVWRQGVLGYGLAMFFAMTIAMPLFDWMLGERPQGPSSWIVRFVIGVPLWLGMGYLFGRGLWWIREKEYHAALAKGFHADDRTPPGQQT